MFSGPFLKTAISLGIGLGLGAADYYFFILGARYLTTKFSGKKFPLAFFISEMVRLVSLLGIILVLALQRKSISIGWMIIGPVVFGLIKYPFLFGKLRKT